MATTQAPTPVPVRDEAAAAPTNRVRTTVVVVLLLAVSFVVLLPFLWMLSASVRTAGDFGAHPSALLPHAFTFRNYVSIWSAIPIGRMLLNTTIFAVVVTAGSVLFDSMAGYALARFDFPGKKVVFLVIISTLMLPFQATLIPIFKLLTDIGWVNTYQGLIVPRLADAFGIFFMRQFFISLPQDLEQAARIDGAGEFRIFARIMAPLAVPAFLTISLFNLLANWNDLLWPLVLTNSTSMQTLTVGLSLFKGQHATDYGLLMTGSLLALLPMVVAFLLVQRRFVEGIATTGVK